MFSVKAPRFAVNRKVLAEAGESIERFFASGIDRLGDKLGPVLWQFAGTKRFEAEDFGKLLKLLPGKLGRRTLRHVVEPRHESFRDPAFYALVKDAGVAVVFADADDYPNLFDTPTADFAYARLQRCVEDIATGYDEAALDRWATLARGWAKRGDAFVYFISGAKVRAPAAATALIARLAARE